MIISTAKAMEAAAVLGVQLNGLTPEDLSRAYRGKAQSAHPDGGGKIEDWARVSWAKECLVHWLERTPAEQSVADVGACRACGGSGRVQVSSRGFKPLTVMCVMCNGDGQLNPERAQHFVGRSER